MENQISEQVWVNLKANQLSVIYLNNLQAEDFLKDKKHFLNTATCYYIGKESRLLPFLSVRENLSIDISKKEQRTFQQQLLKWTQAFKLNAQLSTTDPEKLSEEMILLVHLVRALSLNRELILIDTLSLVSSMSFIQSLVPALKKAAKEKAIKIVLITRLTTDQTT